MNKLLRHVLIGALCITTLEASAQVNYDKIFVNNCAVLNMIPTTATDHDFKDIIYIVSGANNTVCGYKSVVVEAVKYKESFGSFVPTNERQTALIMLNDGSTMRVGRTQVKTQSPKRIWIYPGDSAGNIDSYVEPGANPLAFYDVGYYALVYNANTQKDSFYMKDGSLLFEDAYVQKDSKGRITEIYSPGGFSIAGFFFGVSYNESGDISSIKELRRVRGKNGAITKQTKRSIDFTWKGDVITRIHSTDAYGKTYDYNLEIKEKNEDGVWTEALLTHKDINSADGKFIDSGLVRKFQ